MCGDYVCLGVWRLYVCVCECMGSIYVFESVKKLYVCVLLQLEAASEAGGIFNDGKDFDRATSLGREG